MSEALAASIIVNLALAILTIAKRLPLPKGEKEPAPALRECAAHKGLINWLKDTRDELKANTVKIAEVAENLARLEGRMFP